MGVRWCGQWLSYTVQAPLARWTSSVRPSHSMRVAPPSAIAAMKNFGREQITIERMELTPDGKGVIGTGKLDTIQADALPGLRATRSSASSRAHRTSYGCGSLKG